MPSVGTSLSQIPSRVGFFRVMYGDGEETFTLLYSFTTVPSDGAAVSVLEDQGTTPVDAVAGDMLKDMGKRITLLDSNGLVSVVLNKVQRVNGSGSEGVPSTFATDADLYAVVFSADPSAFPVHVVRTG